MLASYDLLVVGHKALGICAGAAGLAILLFAMERWSEIHSDRWFRSGFVNGMAASLICLVLYVTLGHVFTRLQVLDTPGVTSRIDIQVVGIVVLTAIPMVAVLVLLLRGVGWLYRGRHAA
jgi:hypothetical protein